ncbi:phage I-like protein [Crenobacter luteus]|uniref:phage protease n=1 Tax=Crenobacter luteus TaxID=1452487 RepID=UPI00105310BC|nr:phage protease [Crenobacter luteus]TCP09248.1 phage I-like protein [Crenobacter luteus]
MATKTSTPHIAALVFELDPANPKAVRLLPAGQFRARDGRPWDAPYWLIDAAIAANVIRRAANRADNFVIDYEHQTLLADQNGQPAPAAGWFKTVEWREDGLYAVDVEWTPRATQMLADREYRYPSPVFRYDPATGEVLELLHAALTNHPALDGLTDLATLAALKFSSLGESKIRTQSAQPDQPHQENHIVTLAELLQLLGLPADTDEAGAKAALAALKTRADKTTELEGQVTALKASTETPDPAKFVPLTAMKALQDQLVALSSQVTGREVDELVASAIQDAKLLPAQEAWAKELGKKDIAALKQYLTVAQPIAALTGTQTGGKKPAGADDKQQLSAEELAVCKALGQDPAVFAKNKE